MMQLNGQHSPTTVFKIMINKALVNTFLFAGLCLLSRSGLAQAKSAIESKSLVFSYFKGNGADGLHLAYSKDGLNWRTLNNNQSFVKPKVGKDKLMRDPSIVLGPEGVYHMVWTVSWHEKGIGYASSTDLIHWSRQKYVPVMEHEGKARNCWAPELFYDAGSKKYLIYWATTIPERFPETDGQDGRENDPGWNHRIYFVTTSNFEGFSETKLFYDPGFNVIDAFIFKDDSRKDQQFVMLLKDETNKPFIPQKNIRLAFSEQAEGPYSKPSEPITGDYWAEGPTAIKIGEEWFVYFDKYTAKQYGVLTSSDLQVWTDRSDQLNMPQGMRHGTVFEATTATAKELLALDK